MEEQSEIKHESYELTTEETINVKLGLSLWRFYLGGSVALGNFQVKGLKDDDGNQKDPISGIPVGGTFGMGFNMPLSENIVMDFSLLSFPGLTGFTTLTYKF